MVPAALSFLGAGSLRKAGWAVLLRDDEIGAGRGRHFYESGNPVQHFFHRRVRLCQAVHLCFGDQWVVEPVLTCFSFSLAKEAESPASRQPRGQQEIQGVQILGPLTHPALLSALWLPGLHTWVPKSPLSHIPKGLSFTFLF